MIEVDKVGTLYIGHTGENDAELFDFDYSAWIKRYGEGQLLLSIKRACDNMPYPATLDIKGNIATWIVKKVDVSVKGTGVAEFTYKVNSVIKKSAQFRFVVIEAFDGNTAVPTDPDSWLNAITQKVLEGQGYADEAKKAADSANLDAIATESNRVITDELAKAVDADAKEVAANKVTVVEAQKAVDLAEQRVNTAVEDIQLMQLDVQTNKDEIDIAKTEVDKKSTEVADNAKAVGINAAATEENAKVAELAKNDAVTASNSATEAAKQAELSVNKGGYVYFNIKNGHLFFTRTETSEFDFKLEEGRLIAYAK